MSTHSLVYIFALGVNASILI